MMWYILWKQLKLNLDDFKKESRKDEVLSRVVNYLSTGWPNKWNNGGELKHYFKLRN